MTISATNHKDHQAAIAGIKAIIDSLSNGISNDRWLSDLQRAELFCDLQGALCVKQISAESNYIFFTKESQKAA